MVGQRSGIGLNRPKVLQSTLAGIGHLGGNPMVGQIHQRVGRTLPGRNRRKVLQSTLGAQMAGEEKEKEEEEEEEKEKEEEREERGERQDRQRKVLQSTVWSSPRRQ